MEQPWGRLRRFEGPTPTKHLAAIVSRHSHRSDLAGPLVEVQVGGIGQVNASVGEVDRALGVVGKAREELLPDRDDLVGLFACTGHLPCHNDVATSDGSPTRPRRCSTEGIREGRFCQAMIIRVSSPPVRDMPIRSAPSKYRGKFREKTSRSSW